VDGVLVTLMVREEDLPLVSVLLMLVQPKNTTQKVKKYLKNGKRQHLCISKSVERVSQFFAEAYPHHVVYTPSAVLRSINK
jgi:hypothetical protein